MQPGTTPSMAPPQHQQQLPQQTRYQVPPSQQPAAAGYHYQAAFPPQPYSAARTTPEDGIRSLWIGDLQYWMDEQYLQNCFATAGEVVVSAKVIRNKQTGESECYGFIEFASHAAAQRNLQTFSGTLMPTSVQPFRLNWAFVGSGEKRLDDAPEYTIFVGDLSADVTDCMLLEAFRPNYPSTKGAKVVTDRETGRSKGFGFVRFCDESEQIRAQTEMNGRFCSSRPMRIGPAANKQRVGGPSEDVDPFKSNTTVFVGNLEANVTDGHLRQLFGQHGELVDVKIPVGKRCGFVQFADRSCAEEAIQTLNGTQLAGQNIRLSWGRSPSNKQVDTNQWSGSSSSRIEYSGFIECVGFNH